jgi:hypothetical protein
MPGVLAIQENAQDYDEGGKREENDGGSGGGSECPTNHTLEV